MLSIGCAFEIQVTGEYHEWNDVSCNARNASAHHICASDSARIHQLEQVDRTIRYFLSVFKGNTLQHTKF